MGLLQRRTRLGQVVKTIGDAQLPSAVTSALGEVRGRPPKAVASGLAAAVAVTAGSAAVSALRRRDGSSGSER
jgi:hypothetical protein